jgi:hypothetical protein
MQHSEKKPENSQQMYLTVELLRQTGFRLKLSYHDESLEKLKDRHRELTLLNELLNQKVEEFLRENP